MPRHPLFRIRKLSAVVLFHHGAFFLGLLGLVAFSLFGNRLLGGFGSFVHYFGLDGLDSDFRARLDRDFGFHGSGFLNHGFDDRSRLYLRSSGCSSSRRNWSMRTGS